MRKSNASDLPKRKPPVRPSGTIRIGVGGWTFPPWRGVFYPKGLPQARELNFASERLTAIEINATYYRTQKPASFARWRDSTPPDFVFTLKAPRYSTHRRDLRDARESIGWFIDSGIGELGDKLGPINWQLAETKTFDREEFAKFLDLLPRKLGDRALRHAIEPRHESFRDSAFVELLRENDIAIVIDAQSRFPMIGDITASFVYARLMGAREELELGYSEAELDLWSKRAQAWSAGRLPAGLERIAPASKDKRPRDVFLFAISGFKARDPAAAMALIERLKPRPTG